LEEILYNKLVVIYFSSSLSYHCYTRHFKKKCLMLLLESNCTCFISL